MSRRAALVSLGSAAALLTALLSAGPAVSAPDLAAPTEPEPRGATPQTPAGPPQADRDGDRVSDDLEPRLRAAEPGEQLDVIVMGVGPGRAGTVAGPFGSTQRLPLVDGFAASMTAAQVRALARLPEVRRIAADGVVRALDDAGNDDFGASLARAETTPVGGGALDGSGVGVCVVDTGVDPGHEQLSGRVAGFFDAIAARTTPYDDHGHGTHVANIALGDGTGSGAAAQAVGVAPAATLYAAKVLDGSGYGSDSQVVRGVEWCTAQTGAAAEPDVRVISMSLGDDSTSDGDDPLSVAVEAAVAQGFVVVVAAGNSGDAPSTVNAPGVTPGAVTVAAASEWSAPSTAGHDNGIWLAAFSSRGPAHLATPSVTVTKPDITAPGVSVLAADAGTGSGYVTMSGTSMATPFVAGALALAVQVDPGATPTSLKAALMQTAADRGLAGVDNEWGAGLIDVRRLVDVLASDTTPDATDFPAWAYRSGVVPNGGYVDVPLTVPSSGGGKPLAATLTITSGQALCYWGCLIQEWSPDLDMVLLNSSGQEVTRSECALSGISCGIGRQETIGIPNVSAGATYTLRVFAFNGSPNNGQGGSFQVDLSNAVVGTTPPPDPDPDPENVAPTVSAGADRTVRVNKRTGQASFTLKGTVTDPEDVGVPWRWTLGSDVLSSGTGEGTVSLSQSRGVGTYTYVLSATDSDGATASDAVTVTVRR
jgi:serine protease AprX